MERKSVTSSGITSIGHDAATDTLHVEFASGAVHEYHGVTAEKHAALMAADSIGSHFSKNIRNAHGNRKVK